MNWKCPQCGADGNEQDACRCACGYELDEKNRLTVQWVQPPVETPITSPQPTGLKPPKTAKQKIGEALYIFPIVILIFVVVLLLTTKWFPTKSTIAAIISAAGFISTVSSLLTDDIGIAGVGAVKRTEKPKVYWAQFIFQSVAVVAFLLIAIYVKE
jgi:hypothetical protein